MKVRNFNEWASAVYEGKTPSVPEIPTSFFDRGESDGRSIFEMLFSSVDSTINETLDEIEFNFYEADRALVSAITESLRTGEETYINEMFDSVKKAIINKIDNAKELINKGIQIGSDLYTSTKQIAGKIKDAVSKVYEKVKRFLTESSKVLKAKAAKYSKKVKDFVKSDLTDAASASLASILQSKSAESEMEEAPKDIKGAAGKITGKTLALKPEESIDSLKKSAEELDTADSDEVDEFVIDNLVDVKESVVYNIVTSIKGLLLEGYTIETLNDFLDENETLDEEHSDKKSLLGWMIEAIGFALSPFSKLYEYAIKATVNGTMDLVSVVARGGAKNAYKYVVMGTICSLVYHIIHGMSGINQHMEHLGKAHEAVASKKFEIKFGEKKVVAIENEDLSNIAKAAVGQIFASAISSFFPVMTLVFEIFITAFAAFEMGIAFCQLSSSNMESNACKIIMKAEHSLESVFS